MQLQILETDNKCKVEIADGEWNSWFSLKEW